MFHFEEDFIFQDALSIPAGRAFGLWDLPSGPEPGPEMPKRRKPLVP
ncbi:MAG: hypothetical protein ACE14P_07755 [Methanotrichaceae archaeon]